jgi:hypothetical protein
MPILIVVKRSRRPLFVALRRLVARPGLVAVVLERRAVKRRRGPQPIPFPERRYLHLRQPLDGDNARLWAELGCVLVKVHRLPDDLLTLPPPARRPRGARRRPPTRVAHRPRARPARRRTA